MKKVTKPITLEILASDMKKGFAALTELVANQTTRVDRLEDIVVHTSVSVDTLALMMAKRFEKVERRIDVFEDRTDKNFENIRGEILKANDRFVTKDIFDKHISSFKTLETKAKGKVK